jgi:hypothetical protein
MSLRIGIVGAGWYGCHLAASFLGLGFDVRVFDRHGQVMREASGNNQFRLHLGFHYARHHRTRLQSRDGFQRFLERYPALSAEVAQNIYAVPRRTSLIDFSTYQAIMAASGIDSVVMHAPHPALAAVEGCLSTRERVILLSRARRMFEAALDGHLALGEAVAGVQQNQRHATINGERFDYVIDATWGHLRPLPIEVFYEPTLLLYYEATEPQPAFTFVDGPLASVYPTEDASVFTLSSVPHTPLGQCASAAGAYRLRDRVDRTLVQARRGLMEAQIRANIPAFPDMFRFLGAQLSIKTKPVGGYEDRSCTVFREGRVFTVMSGKIDTIFFASERILSMIEADHDIAFVDQKTSQLRDSILLLE